MKSNYQVHETAIIEEGAQIGKDTKIWHWVHVCSGAKIGSNVYIIDWLTGKVKKRIDIEDVPNDIVNSLPSTPVVVKAIAL